MIPDRDGYKNPLSTATPSMTIAGILTWLDLEVEYLKEQYDKEESSMVKVVLMGTWLHLNVMKEQLEGYTLQILDADK